MALNDLVQFQQNGICWNNSKNVGTVISFVKCILSLWLKLNYTLINVMAKWNKTFPSKLKWSVSRRSLALSHVYNQSYIIFILQYMVTGEVGLLCLAVLNLVAEVHNTVSECAIIRIRNTVATGVREMQQNIIDVMKSLA